jgi:ParB family chromosome partitioning protein
VATAADRLGTGGAFGAISRTPRSERGRAKAQAEGAIPDYEIQRLPLNRVALCPMNPRRYYGTEEQREALGQSLAKKQTTACVAVPRAAYLALWPNHTRLINEEAEYVLLNGERRHRSASQVGLEVLDFVVHDDLATSPADFMDYLMAENEDSEDFNVIEWAMGLEQLLKACDGNAAEVTRRRRSELTEWQAEHNREHKQVRARVERVFAHMKTWKILRGCRLKGSGVHTAMLGIARPHNLLQTA